VSNKKVTTQSAFSRTGLQNPVGNDKMIENDQVGRFRSSQRHPEVIKSALERFENTLLVRENQKLMEEQTFKDQIEHNKAYSRTFGRYLFPPIYNTIHY